MTLASDVPSRRRRVMLHLAAALIASGTVLLVLRWMASEVFEGETDRFDDSVRAAIHNLATEPLTRVFVAISFIGSPLFIGVCVLATLAVLFYLGRRRQMMLLAAVMAGEIVLDVALKHVYERVRPEPYFGYTLPSSFSFPSGHALGSVCFYGTFALIMSSFIANAVGRAALWTAAAATIVLVGISRVYLGVHYPTDILAGYIVGSVWIVAVWMSFRMAFPEQIEKHGAE